jgi:hypothetical protein
MEINSASYDRLDIRTTWVTTKNFGLTYDQVLSYDPHAGQGHLSYDPHGVRKYGTRRCIVYVLSNGSVYVTTGRACAGDVRSTGPVQ